jgi:hypothetical protein
VALNVVLCAFLSPVLGNRGIAVALTTSAYFKLGILSMHTGFLLGPDRSRALLLDVSRALGAGATTLVISRLVERGLEALGASVPGLVPVKLALLALGMAAAYLLTLRLFCPEELVRYRAAIPALVRRGGESRDWKSLGWARPEEGK